MCGNGSGFLVETILPLELGTKLFFGSGYAWIRNLHGSALTLVGWNWIQVGKKITQKNRKKWINFMFWRAGCFLLIGLKAFPLWRPRKNCSFWYKKIEFFSSCKILLFWEKPFFVNFSVLIQYLQGALCSSNGILFYFILLKLVFIVYFFWITLLLIGGSRSFLSWEVFVLYNYHLLVREPSEDLKYLNIDYTQFDEWSSDEEVTIYTGIEKGYERWLQHPHEDPR